MNKTNRIATRVFLYCGVALVLATAACAAAIGFGGPRAIDPLASINDPFTKADFSDVPVPQMFGARDGTQLAWLHYRAVGGTLQARRLVLVHGSSARARSMHVLARSLAQAGFDVAALDMRGHGDSGVRGQATHVGQLEEDLADFLQAVPYDGPSTLVGFSSGGGFALRFAGGPQQALFDRYVLLAPYLHHAAPINRPHDGGWVSVGLPRYIALTLLNRLAITVWNHLPVLRFGLDRAVRDRLTSSYSYTLAQSFRPRDDWQQDIRQARRPMRLVAGSDDELFDVRRYANLFSGAGRPLPVTLVDGVNHIGLTLDPRAVPAIVEACRN